ncbi:MAG TPA: alpha/beta fold hydrolase [Vicinamibacterales bacterium]|nr:alpha/beta fold hydrolase [Vicinamibacterales bacterium]
MPANGSLGFLLVHGGAHDARCWARLIPHLAYPTLAIDLPGRGTRPGHLASIQLADFVVAAVEDLDGFRNFERVILVGHSMAGITIPAIAAQRPDRIAQMVFVSCFIPPEGKAIADEFPWLVRKLVERASSGAPRRMPQWLARRLFCNGMTLDAQRFSLSVTCPEPIGVIFESVTRATLPPPEAVPRTYIKLLQDRALRPSQQERFIANLGGCEILALDAGHNAMISEPVALASLLNEIANRFDPATLT